MFDVCCELRDVYVRSFHVVLFFVVVVVVCLFVLFIYV